MQALFRQRLADGGDGLRNGLVPQLLHVELVHLEDDLHGGAGEQHQNDGAQAHRTAQQPADGEGAALQQDTHQTHGHLGGAALEDAHQAVAGAGAQPGGHINIHTVSCGDQGQDAQDQPGDEAFRHGQTSEIGQQSEAGDHVAGAEVHHVAAQQDVDKSTEADFLPEEDVDHQNGHADGDVGAAKGDQVGAVCQLNIKNALQELCHTVVQNIPGLHAQVGHQSHGRAEAHDAKADEQTGKAFYDRTHKKCLRKDQFQPE